MVKNKKDLAKLYVVEIHDESYTGNRFRIIEKRETIDGPRDRITNYSFESLDAAIQFVNEWKGLNHG